MKSRGISSIRDRVKYGVCQALGWAEPPRKMFFVISIPSIIRSAVQFLVDVHFFVRQTLLKYLCTGPGSMLVEKISCFVFEIE